jgi:hypothetical protein
MITEQEDIVTARVSWIAISLLLAQVSPSLAESKTFDVEPFTAVSISSGLVGFVADGPEQSVTVDGANDAVLSRLQVAVRNGRLEVGIEWNPIEYLFSLGQRPEITVHVVAPAISSVDASAGANVDVAAPLVSSLGSSSGAHLVAKAIAADRLVIDASSGASIEAVGTCERLDVSASSGAGVLARDLQCGEVDADASTGAHLTVWATERVTADASTGAEIAIGGNPSHADLDSSVGGNAHLTP